ncbi:uncharacterized protein BYT42DRAFT_548085 [Radiomyces spectabilis]|uniref:uncharacterized protein n=1 Tax=Radiomyces spectabilis TaxID=64574 RepID=UPI00221E660F|nr:uncharacterized protein BYT42DRAFT_548085 [Radiomyces spectabilis]KAI8373098.1 hypothetical protein BYT42DRAFT_548085 [Radiomyces spectabilis]
MNIADMLNPSSSSLEQTRLISPPLSPKQHPIREFCPYPRPIQNNGKPRSRFSDLEDAIICEGVAKGLTWGQISGQLPHRKRATCFNRYRTLQGIRKSRKRLSSNETMTRSMTPPSPVSPSTPASWLPTTPPPCSESSPPSYKQLLPSPRQVLMSESTMLPRLPPLLYFSKDHSRYTRCL